MTSVMTNLLAPVASLVQTLQSSASVHDTLIMKQVLPARGLFEQIQAVASAIITVAFLVFLIVSLPLAWHFRKTYKKLHHLIDRVYGDITPITHNVNSITDNINYITTAVRQDLAKVSASIDDANDRVQRAMEQAERRVNEFNALLAVVQDEAEQLFVSTASAVHGVRGGAAAFGRRGGPDFASDELAAAELAEHYTIQEEGDGHDGSPQSAAEALPAAPRVRPRDRSRRRA
jgi:uncharacterized protein YoxC